MNDMMGRDPTRPVAPAFTKAPPKQDTQAPRSTKRMPGGLVTHPILFAKLNGGGNGRAA